MDDVLIRLAEVEKKVSGERSRRICKINVNISLAKLTSSEKEQTTRLETIIHKAKTQMDDIIFKNGRAPKEQRDSIKQPLTG